MKMFERPPVREPAAPAVPPPPGSAEEKNGAGRDRKRGLFSRTAGLASVAAVVALSLQFGILYSSTFRGHRIHSWTHGPFNFESGIYRNYALGVFEPATTDNDKLTKHFLMALLYPQMHRLIDGFFPIADSPLVCAALGGATILLFGIWLGARVKWSPVVIPVLLLLGFSFTTWYVSSVWESRAFMMFGSMILLIALDGYLRRPTAARMALGVLAVSFAVLISAGRLYLFALLPLAVLIRAGRTGFLKTAGRLFIGSIAAVAIVALAYEGYGRAVNPRTRLREFIGIAGHERQHIGASPARLNAENYRTVTMMSLVYGVGGLYLPCGDRMVDREWANPRAHRAYLYHLPGTIFIAAAALLTAAVLIIATWRGSWWREPVLLVILVGVFLNITFFVYFNPWAGPVYAAETMPLLWGFVGIVLGGLRPRKLLLGSLLLFSLITAWNNLTVINYFRYYYGTPADRAAIEEAGRKPREPAFRPGGV